MNLGREVTILFVERDEAVWPRAEAFFVHQLSLVGSSLNLQLRARIPNRAAGFDLVSLDGCGLLSALLHKPELLADLQRTAVVNLHAEAPGRLYGHLRHLLGRHDERLRSDGLWVFPQSWMASWFDEALEFPELGLSTNLRPRRPRTPDRTWERRSVLTMPRPAVSPG